MKSIFDITQQDEVITFEDFEISHEMIAPQLNDEYIAQMEVELDAIVDFIIKRKIKPYTHEKAMRDIDYKSHLEKIEVLTSKRFGFNVKIFDGGMDCPAACLPIPPKEFNVLGQRVNQDVYEQIEKERSTMKQGKDNQNDYRTPYEKRSEYAMLDTACTTIKAMNDLMNAKGFKVDLNKAKIIGLPSEYIIDLIFNFASLVVKYGMTTREILAVFLHEIGHCFTHLESSYRYLSNTTVLIDTFMYNLCNKNKTPRESYTIAYKKVTKNNDIDKLKDKNNLTFYIVTGSRLTDFLSNTASPHYSVDSEQQADQFAGRFGLGEELGSGLNKMFKDMTGIGAMLLYGIVATLCFTICVVAPILFSLVGPLGFIFVCFLYSCIFKKNSAWIKYNYDDDKQRLVRIRNESVRLLRSSNLDKATVESLLGNIESLDYIIDHTREGFLGPIDKIYQTFFPGGKRKLELKNIEETMERLMENDLHIAKHKLK